MKNLLFILLLCLAGSALHAQLIWDGDASNGTGIFKATGTGNVEAPSTLTAISDPVRGLIWRYHKPSGSNRCENHGIKLNGASYVFQNNTTYYFGWSTKLTDATNNNANFQWKSYGTHIQNFPVVLKMIDGRMHMLQRQPENQTSLIWSIPFSANTWYHITIALHLSDELLGGWVEIWFNGVKQTFTNGTQRYACRTFDGGHVCPKWGVYGASATTMTNFVDDLKVGSSWASVQPVGTPPQPPAAPASLTANAVSSSRIDLGWADNSSNEDQFRIERSTDGGSNWSFLANAAADATSYQNTGLTASTTYHYRVRAENSAGNSAYSNTANATTGSGTTLINVALNKTATASGNDGNLPGGAVDGSTTSRWSASPIPQWLEVDLGAVYDISRTELVAYEDRAYRFTVEAKTTAGGTYAQIVNRSSNTTPGTIAAPITDNFTAVPARYVRLNVTGASGYTGTWASIIEFRVFGVAGGSLPPVGVGTTQAESLNLSGFEANTFEGADAIRAVNDNVGSANGSFTGTTGNYDITVRYFDENDGAATLRLLVGGVQAGSITLNVNDNTWKDWVIPAIAIANGQEIRFEGSRQSGEHLRVDYLNIATAAQLLTAGSSGSAGIENARTDLKLTVVPNPVVNQQTMFRYSLQQAGRVRIAVYNMAGQEEVITNAFQQAGNYSVPWNTRGKAVGVYIARINAGETVKSVKVVVK